MRKMSHPDQPGHVPAEDHANPDLDRILAELAGYSASKTASLQPPVSAAAAAPPAASSPAFPTHHHAYPQQPLPARYNLPSAPSTPQPQSEHVSRTNTPVSKPLPVATAPIQNQIDPSTIFEWPQALRCVNKISASNPQFGPKLKEMIADQERNVKQWWDDRNNFISSQKTKNEGRRSLNEVLKGIGGKLEAESTPEQDQAELARFDKKVYHASEQMNKVHAIELKRLGVPFFGVNPKFIIANELQQTTAARDVLSQATITEAELLDLQKKMIQYLEDLYKD